MNYIDKTQEILADMAKSSECILTKLIQSKDRNGSAKIITNLDLGFPHDVIRIAGGFMTGIHVKWRSNIPIIPVDICMNVCTVSVYKVHTISEELLTQKSINDLINNLNKSSYIANFHRGNHFISYVESIKTMERYIIIHSSAAEFETMYNGLYPVENNYFHRKILYLHQSFSIIYP